MTLPYVAIIAITAILLTVIVSYVVYGFKHHNKLDFGYAVLGLIIAAASGGAVHKIFELGMK